MIMKSSLKQPAAGYNQTIYAIWNMRFSYEWKPNDTEKSRPTFSLSHLKRLYANHITMIYRPL